MASNDFLPFATGSGANVTAQSTYAAQSTTGTGFQSGLAKSADMNKALRQATFVSAMIGQFIADQASVNAADDGVVANLESGFLAAIRAAIPGAFVYSTGATGYIKFPGTNAPIIKWGTTGGVGQGAQIAVTFAPAFPTACFAVLVSPISAGANTLNYSVAVNSISTSGFNLTNNSGTSGSVTATYIAFGN